MDRFFSFKKQPFRDRVVFKTILSTLSLKPKLQIVLKYRFGLEGDACLRILKQFASNGTSADEQYLGKQHKSKLAQKPFFLRLFGV